jgi:hypothetical protein
MTLCSLVCGCDCFVGIFSHHVLSDKAVDTSRTVITVYKAMYFLNVDDHSSYCHFSKTTKTEWVGLVVLLKTCIQEMLVQITEVMRYPD